MKLKTKIGIVSVLIVCAGCVLLLRLNVKDPVEQAVQAVLEDPPTNEDKVYKKRRSPELENFLSWYEPMVKDASPEVRAVMKKFDAQTKHTQHWIFHIESQK